MQISAPETETPSSSSRPVATAVVRGARILRNAAIDLRYGSVLAGTRLRDRDHSNTDYGALRSVQFEPVLEDDVLVDVGCGAGRVINHWLSLGYRNPMIGLELEDTVAEKCARRLRAYPNVEIRSGDAIHNLPREGTIFYMFNPMRHDDTGRLEASLRAVALEGRLRRVIYYNPKFIDFFGHNGDWDIEIDACPGGRTVAPFQPVAYICPSAAR